MRLTLLLTLLFVALHLPATPAGEAVSSDLTPETDAKISEEALARYSAPGQVGRYKDLLEALKQNPETMGSPARNLRLPVRSFPDGRPQIIVRATDAWITLDTTLFLTDKRAISDTKSSRSQEWKSAILPIRYFTLFVCK